MLTLQHSLNLFLFFLFFLILKSLILTCVPKHEPPSHRPPHNISLGHPHAPAPSMLYPASDIDWQFDSYMIVYMFQCHSPKSSHPLPLPLSPKVRYMLSRLVITFLPGSKRLNFKAAVTICSDFGAPQNKAWHRFCCFPTYLPRSDGTRCHDLSFLSVEH